MFDLLIDPCIQFIGREQFSEPVPSVDNNLAAKVVKILILLAPHVPLEGVPRSEEMENALANILAHIEPIFIMALMRIGATADT